MFISTDQASGSSDSQSCPVTLLRCDTDLKGHQKATTPHSWASIPRDVICQYPISLSYMTGISTIEIGFSCCSCRDGARLRRNTTPRQEEDNGALISNACREGNEGSEKMKGVWGIRWGKSSHACAGQSHWPWQSPSSLKQRLTSLDYNTSALSRALQRQTHSVERAQP